MNSTYKEPEFNIVFTNAQDVISLSDPTGGFAGNNGYNGEGGAPWGGSGSTGIEI